MRFRAKILAGSEPDRDGVAAAAASPVSWTAMASRIPNFPPNPRARRAIRDPRAQRLRTKAPRARR